MSDLSFPFVPAIAGYATASLLFIGICVHLVVRWRGGVRAVFLLLILAASALWTLCATVAFFSTSAHFWIAANFFDGLRLLLWLLFLLLLTTDQSQQNRGQRQPDQWRYFVAPALLFIIGVFGSYHPPWEPGTDGKSAPAFYALLGVSIFGLVLIERVHRQTAATQWWAVKPLVIGLFGLFTYDLIQYSGAVLFQSTDVDSVAARGFIHALACLFVAVAGTRTEAWTVDLHLSRETIFQSAALIAAGVYLTIIALAGYWVHVVGGTWSGTLKVALVFAGTLGLVVVTLSGTWRSRLKVFLGKNLYAYRYDYRSEWLRFTRLLGTAEPGETIYAQVVRAMAELVESTGGALWLERHGVLVPVAGGVTDGGLETEALDSPFCRFLSDRKWVIDLAEYAREPHNYPDLRLPAWIGLRNAWLVVPVFYEGALMGIVVLDAPRADIDVNWEVRDILKTASKQVATFLAQIRIKESLVESEKFDAFNRMSAFVVHDLKNLIAQLVLLLKNAERHKDNPEFQADMLETVQHTVERMNRMMLQLRMGTTSGEVPSEIELGALTERVLKANENFARCVNLDIDERVRAVGHVERLERVVGHLVQNGIEACRSGEERVMIRVRRLLHHAVIEVRDNGIGMTPEFVRDRLFHAFQTSKLNGMGIGMYESYQYITSIGGTLNVQSAVGEGTLFRVVLPLASSAVATPIAKEA